MSSIGKPPCDEGAILTAVPSHSSSGCGPWVLAATILGSSMAFIDGTVGECCSSSAAVGARSNGFRSAMGHRKLCAFPRGSSLAWRLAWRSVWPAEDLLCRRSPIRIASAWCGLAPDILQLITARAVQGVGGCASRTGKPCTDQRFVSCGRARTRDRNLVGFHGHHRCCRSRSRRMAGRARFLALGFFYQLAHRGRRFGNRFITRAGEPRSGT